MANWADDTVILQMREIYDAIVAGLNNEASRRQVSGGLMGLLSEIQAAHLYGIRNVFVEPTENPMLSKIWEMVSRCQYLRSTLTEELAAVPLGRSAKFEGITSSLNFGGALELIASIAKQSALTDAIRNAGSEEHTVVNESYDQFSILLSDVPSPNRTSSEIAQFSQRLASNSPVIAEIVGGKIGIANGPSEAIAIQIDPEKLENLLHAANSLVGYLLEDLSHQSSNMSPAIHREVARYAVALRVSKPIWCVLEDVLLGLHRCLIDFADDPWPGASRDYIVRLIERTKELEPLLKPLPVTSALPPIVLDEALSNSNLKIASSILTNLAENSETATALTDTTKDFIRDTSNQLSPSATSTNSAKKKGILAAAGFLLSAIRKAGVIAGSVESFLKLIPHMQNALEWFLKFMRVQ